ncbi:MAG: diguanylate cyclase [Pseudomonadota bacterium]|nr:diguanylate cyclase [Pseudomonadota bacterium]
MNARIVLLTLLALAGTGLFGQTVARAETLQGTPLLRRFLPEDYQATPHHWALTTDQAGRLFVGNGEGVLRYDGERWDLIGLPGRYPARELATGHDGHIYVGSYDSFGWLQENAAGETEYRELLTAAGLRGKDRAVGNVWQVIATADGVYFRSEKSLHLLDYRQRLLKHWPLQENQRAIYKVGSQLFARIDGLGFTRFADGKFELEPGGGVFADQGLLGVIPHRDGLLLISNKGFFLADAEGISPMGNGAGTQLRDSQAHTVLPLEDGSFVVGTLQGEVFRYGRDGRLRDRMSLGSFGISALGTDHEGGLWAATEGDLVRMSMPSPWSYIGATDGLQGSVFDFEWYQGALWLATTRGMARMQTGPQGNIQTRQLPWVDFEAFALAGTAGGLLVAHRDGLLVLEPGATEPRKLLSQPESVLELVESRFDPDVVYGLSDQRLIVIDRRNGRWQAGAGMSLEGASAVTLLETAPGELWFGDTRGGAQRWTLGPDRRALVRRQVFGPEQGLVLDTDFGSSVYLLDGQVHAVSGDRAFRFQGPGFVPDTTALPTLVDRPDELLVEQTPLGAYAFTLRQMWFRHKAGDEWQPLHLGSRLAGGYARLRYHDDGVVRVATWNGILQFDPREPMPEPAPLALGFDRIVVRPSGNGAARRLALQEPGLAEIPPGARLQLRYGAISMGSTPEYRYRLEGGDAGEEWSRWGGGDLVLPASAAGDYMLTVEARTASGRTAEPISFGYRVLPRWHEQWWLRLLGMLTAVALGAVAVRELVRRRTQRLAEANRELEARIGARTHELEELNRKLGELATEDALTGVANRRAMQNGLQREWVRCLDQQRPLSVLMIDVDFFKRYNDEHGHLEGDVLLRSIAQNLHALHDPTREMLARFGGEEFALLLPNVTQEDAVLRAEQVRAAMQERLHPVTVSIGVAGYVPGATGDSVDLLRCADAALYRAKRAGRNQVESAPKAAEPVPG